MAQRPPSGWYPDPVGPTTDRWWDGRGWTEHRRPAVALPAAVPGWGPPAGEAPGSPPAPPDRWPTVTAPAREGSPAPGWPPAPLPTGGAPSGGRIPAKAAWVALAGLLAGEILGGILSVAAAAVSGAKVTGAVPTLLGEIGLWAGMLGACLVVAHRWGTGSLRRDFTLGIRWIDAPIGLLAMVSGYVVVAVVGAAFAGSRLSGTNTQLLTGQRGNGIGFALVTLIAAVGAPFFEELFFRGLIRTALSARLGPIGAIWAQAGLFGLAHFQPTTGLGNISVMVAIGAFGVVLGYTAHLTRRLGAGMVAHSLFNTLAAIIILAT